MPPPSPLPPVRLLFGALLTGLLCGLGAVPAQAQQVVELTIEEAVQRGLERNFRLEAARADADEARAAHRAVRAGLMPSVRSLASYTRLSGNVPEAEFSFPGSDTTFTLLPVELNRYHAEVSIEQPLFTGFRLQNQIRASARRAEAAALLASQEEADVALEIRAAYWQLRQATAVREATAAALAAVEAHIRHVENLVGEGAALRIDLLNAQTRRSEVRLDRVEAENAVRVTRLELNRMIGLPLDTPVEPITDIVTPVLADLDALIEHAVESRPQLAALAEQIRALEAELDVTRGAWLPEVVAVGRFVYARPNPYFFLEQDQFRDSWEVGLTARWSLFEGGRRPAATSQARSRLQAARARLLDAQEAVQVEVMRRFLEVQRSAEAVEVAAQHVAEAEEAFRVVRNQFGEGAALPAQILDAEQALRAAQARQAQAGADHAVAHAALLNATGKVW